MDSKTKFLAYVVALGAAYAIGYSFYKYVVIKDFQIYEIEYEEEGEEEEVFDSADESETETETESEVETVEEREVSATE